MAIEFLNLGKAYTELKTELDQLWIDVNDNSSYILGNRLEIFEQEFANYLGVKHVIGVANGLDALTLAIKAFGISVGDEIIVPAHSFIASWLAVSTTGATPVPVEVSSKTYLLDPSKIEEAITSRTKAIMPVHLYGKLCDMEEIIAIAKHYKLKIIEDAAQAHGAMNYNQKKAGSFGDCAGFSFYPGKNLGCFGDGGAISTDDDNIATELRLLRNYGSKIRYEHEIVGVNSRLDELHAGVLSIKLKYLNEWNKRRQKIAAIYLQELNGINDLVLPKHLQGGVWHIFPVMTSKRDLLKEFLIANEIGVNIHYPKPIYLQKAYEYMNLKQGSFLITERISNQILSLPMGPHLTEEEVMICCQKVKEFFMNI